MRQPDAFDSLCMPNNRTYSKMSKWGACQISVAFTQKSTKNECNFPKSEPSPDFLSQTSKFNFFFCSGFDISKSSVYSITLCSIICQTLTVGITHVNFHWFFVYFLYHQFFDTTKRYVIFSTMIFKLFHLLGYTIHTWKYFHLYLLHKLSYKFYIWKIMW